MLGRTREDSADGFPVERFLKVPHRIFLQLLRLSKREHCPAVVLVYLALLYHADSQGRCFPGYRRIMEIVGIKSETTISKALKILEREGLLSVAHSHGKYGPNRYTLPKLHLLKFKASIDGASNSSEWSLKLHLLEPQTPFSGDELDPINYNQLTIPKELYRREGECEREGKRPRPFGPPEDPSLDEEYYRFP